MSLGTGEAPSPEVLQVDLQTFVSRGAGFWRGAGLEFHSLTTMRVVVEREAPEHGPDARNQAVEEALHEASARLEAPTREAALHLLGLSPEGRMEKGKTKRGNLAAKALHMDGRTFRRQRMVEGGSRSRLEQVIEAVAQSLLELNANETTCPTTPRPLLLYVEDKESFVTIVREALPDYEVISADTLGGAMDALVNGGPFALVLVDPNLTDLDDGAGLEVLEYLRDHLPETPRVVVTGSRFEGAITTNLGERYGVADILIKGDYTLPDLRSTIDRAVKRWTCVGDEQ